jgi:hypothetical protein
VSSLLDVDGGTIAVVIKHPAGGGCASVPGAERGTRLGPLPTSIDSIMQTIATRIFPRGTFRLCAWMLANGGVVARNTSLLTVRAPHGNSGLYQGRTSQHFPLSFGVFGGQIFQFATRARYHCRRGRRSTGSIVQPLEVRDGQYLSDARDGERLTSSTDEITFRFAIRHGRVRGTLRERYISVGGNLCDSGSLRFSGRRY